jgi:alpha-glucosidase
MLSLYRHLIALRRSRPVLVIGAKQLLPAPENVIAYQRVGDRDRLLIALNLGREPRELALSSGKLLLSTHLDRSDEPVSGRLTLRADEGVIVDLTQ